MCCVASTSFSTLLSIRQMGDRGGGNRLNARQTVTMCAVEIGASRSWSGYNSFLYTSEVAWDAALVGTESRRDEWLGWEDVAGRNVIIFLRSQLAAQRLKLPSWRGIWGKSGESWITLSNAAQCALYDSEHPDMHWSGKWWRGYRIGTPHEASLRSEFIDAHRVHFELCQYTKDGKATW